VTALRATGVIMAGPSPTTTPLLIANCDQHIVWGEGKTVDDYIDCVATGSVIGCLATYFTEPDPSKSYVKIDEDTGFAVEVAEKKVISSDAR